MHSFEKTLKNRREAYRNVNERLFCLFIEKRKQNLQIRDGDLDLPSRSIILWSKIKLPILKLAIIGLSVLRLKGILCLEK